MNGIINIVVIFVFQYCTQKKMMLHGHVLHLFAHLLGLEVAHLLGAVHSDVLGGVEALGLPRHEGAVVRRTSLETKKTVGHIDLKTM